MKAPAIEEDSMASCMVSKKTMEVNPKRPVASELKKNASADKSGNAVKDFMWPLFDAPCSPPAFIWTSPRRSRGASAAWSSLASAST